MSTCVIPEKNELFLTEFESSNKIKGNFIHWSAKRIYFKEREKKDINNNNNNNDNNNKIIMKNMNW